MDALATRPLLRLVRVLVDGALGLSGSPFTMEHVDRLRWIGLLAVAVPLVALGVGLSERVGITIANLSILKTNKAKAIRFSTLEAVCRALCCQPHELLEFVEDDREPAERRARRQR